MRILVTGGAGYVGSHVVRLLHEHGHQAVVLDWLKQGNPQAIGDAPLIVGDVGDEAVLGRAFAEHQVEAIIHLAASKSVEESLAEPGAYFRNNVCAMLPLLTEASTRSLPIVFSSSCAVYGTPAELPVTERAPTQPDNPYGETKLMGERMLGWFAASSALTYVSLRYFNAAGVEGGWGEDVANAPNLIPRLLRAAAHGTPIEVFGTDYPTPDGTPIRDYVHVGDLAAAHLRAVEHLRAGGPSLTLNLGTGRGSSVAEVIATVQQVTGRPISWRSSPRRAGDPAMVWADPRGAREALGWTASRDLSEMVRSSWVWFQEMGVADGSAASSSREETLEAGSSS